ncbi:type 4a pilus biogenesis protein PilO [Candidatus Dojkabacteria bacterium]|nr:type 4a pilus biogenesis protein PilO [Candidatus Dojkabacteria bacterium]
MIGKSRDTTAVAQAGKERNFKLGDLVIPILSIGIFLLLVIFVYIPMISDAREMNQEKDEVISNQKQMDKLLEELQSMNSVALKSDYKLFSTMIPTELEVADFAFYVDKLAQEKSLTLNSIRASNADIVQEGTEFGSVTSVSGPLEYSGSYDDIMSFLKDLQESSPYLITVQNVDIQKKDEFAADTWSLEMSVQGFYMKDDSASLESMGRELFYLPFYNYQQDEDLLAVIRDRGAVFLDE